MINNRENTFKKKVQVTGNTNDTSALMLITLNAIYHSFFISHFIDYITISHLIGSTFCIFWLTSRIWTEKFRKYQSLFWYCSLFFALPFPYFIEFFNTFLSPQGVIRFIFSLFILSLLVEWKIFLYLIFCGLIISFIVLSIANPIVLDTFITQEGIIEVIFIIVVMTAVCSILMKNKQDLLDENLQMSNSLSYMLSHEIKTPLAAMRMTLEKLTIEIKNTDCPESVHKKVERISRIENEISEFIYDSLIKVQKSQSLELDSLSIKQELALIRDNYNLNNFEFININIDIEKDFVFMGERQLFRHVIYNLLKNSIDSLRIKPSTEIKIYSQYNDYENILIFEDTGVGIENSLIGKIFNNYFSTKNRGMGIGLFFCKQVIERFGGKIVCESEKNRYTRFKMFFPKLEVNE